MTTTNLLEKERKIRKNLRIKEEVGICDSSWFYPQVKILGIWYYFRGHYIPNWLEVLFLDGPIKMFSSIEDAKKFIDVCVRNKLKYKKIIYHDVNYLTDEKYSH